LITYVLVGDWRIGDEQAEESAMALCQLGESIPHSRSTFCVQHPRINLAVAGGGSQW
jgi:hypothetical protein